MTQPVNTPDITLTAVGSRRALKLAAPGVTTVLLCFSQETQTGIEAVEEIVRERWPSATDVLVAHVVDLKKVPSLFRSVAEGVLAQEHRKAADALQRGLTPYDYVVILPDWQGAVAPALGLEARSEEFGWAVLSTTGAVVATGYRADTQPIVEAIQQAIEQR